MDANIITYLACICLIFVFGRIFIFPIKKILKLIFNSILGGICIFIINLVGANFGFHIGLNFFTSILIRTIRPSRCGLFSNCKIINNIGKSHRYFTVALLYSTVTDFARFLGLSTSNPFSFEI